MSAKEKKKINQGRELYPIEQKLLEFAKRGQPVLLYGGDTPTYRRKALIRNIHLMKRGGNPLFYYCRGSQEDEELDDDEKDALRLNPLLFTKQRSGNFIK